MCGPGNLLGRIANIRGDLKLVGVDIDSRYIHYGRRTYPLVSFRQGDALSWQPSLPIDVVLCTGALHHIPYDLQETAIANIASMISPGKLVIIADCYVNDYPDEIGRKQAAARLGYEYLRVTIDNGAPEDVISWTVDILYNDVLQKEYKTSVARRLPLLSKYFSSIQTLKTWPSENTEYGDYVHICYM